jgi:hypothetical protein
MTSPALLNHKIPRPNPNLSPANPQIAFARFIHSWNADLGSLMTIPFGKTRGP